MGLFSKSKPPTALGVEQGNTRTMLAEIEDVRKGLAKSQEFNPRNPRNVRVAKTIMSLSSNFPETRPADIRNDYWSEARYGNFRIQTKHVEAKDWFMLAHRIHYKDHTVLDWEQSSDSGEAFKVVRFGAWCEEFFTSLIGLRTEIEEQVEADEEELNRRNTEFESTRFKPLDS